MNLRSESKVFRIQHTLSRGKKNYLKIGHVGDVFPGALDQDSNDLASTTSQNNLDSDLHVFLPKQVVKSIG